MFFEEKRSAESEKKEYTRRDTHAHTDESEKRTRQKCCELRRKHTHENQRKTKEKKEDKPGGANVEFNSLFLVEETGCEHLKRLVEIFTVQRLWPMTVQEKSIERTTRTHAKISLLVCLARYHRISHGCDETAAAPSLLTGSCWLLMNVHGWCL